MKKKCKTNIYFILNIISSKPPLKPANKSDSSEEDKEDEKDLQDSEALNGFFPLI